MIEEDENAICKKCGTTADNHFTAWENGVPVVGSYRDAPNGRICSPNAVEAVEKAADKLREAIFTEASSDPIRTAWHGLAKALMGDEPEKRAPDPLPAKREPCQLEWFEARGQAFCNTHKRYELDCVKEDLRIANLQIEKKAQKISGS